MRDITAPQIHIRWRKEILTKYRNLLSFVAIYQYCVWLNVKKHSIVDLKPPTL